VKSKREVAHVELCLPPDPDTRRPAVVPPPLSCDVHCHVFGPKARFPYWEGRPYDPPEAPVENLMRMHDTLGFDRGVVVQSSIHGTDNGAMLYALEQGKGRYRGIANMDGSEPETQLEAMHAAGVRGVRFNFVPFLGGPPDLAVFQRVLDRIAPLGWHVVVHAGGADLMRHEALFRAIRIPVVVDHMGRPDVSQSIDQKPFLLLLDLIKDRGWYTKVSNGERLSAQGFPCTDVLPFARRVIETAPDRVLWGTDWPHPNYTRAKKTPNDCDLLELFYSYAPEREIRRKALVENPARLFGFA